MIELTNNLLGVSSAIVVITTAVLLYFGKIISSTKVERFERTDMIISGLYFTLFFLLFPLAACIFFYQRGWIINISPWSLFVFHLIILGIYSHYKKYKDVKKYELGKEYDKRFDRKIKEIKKHNSFLSYFIKQRPDMIKQSKPLFDIIFGFFENNRVLLLFSIAIFYSIVIVINNANILAVTTIAILSFINLSMIATVHGMSTTYYPFSKISLIDGKKIEGKTLKFGEFIYLLKKDKKYFINKDQVKVIEQNLMKRKEENK